VKVATILIESSPPIIAVSGQCSNPFGPVCPNKIAEHAWRL
jgi:hypothetical protein